MACLAKYELYLVLCVIYTTKIELSVLIFWLFLENSVSQHVEIFTTYIYIYADIYNGYTFGVDPTSEKHKFFDFCNVSVSVPLTLARDQGPVA